MVKKILYLALVFVLAKWKKILKQHCHLYYSVNILNCNKKGSCLPLVPVRVEKLTVWGKKVDIVCPKQLPRGALTPSDSPRPQSFSVLSLSELSTDATGIWPEFWRLESPFSVVFDLQVVELWWLSLESNFYCVSNEHKSCTTVFLFFLPVRWLVSWIAAHCE